MELLKTVEQAYALDANNDNTLWADAISKELENVIAAFLNFTRWEEKIHR